MPNAGPRERFSRLLQHTTRTWRKELNNRLAPLGLTEATWMPLLYLHRSGKPARQVDLAEFLSIDRSSVVRLVDTLEAQGLVTRSEDAHDRRAKRVSLTDAAREIVDTAEGVAAKVRAEVLDEIPEEHVKIATDVLQRIMTRLNGDLDADGNTIEDSEVNGVVPRD